MLISSVQFSATVDCLQSSRQGPREPVVEVGGAQIVSVRLYKIRRVGALWFGLQCSDIIKGISGWCVAS